MDAQQIIAEVLEEHWPDDAQMLGQLAVREIAAAAAAGRKPTYRPANGGHNIDPSVLLLVLSNAASFLASLFAAVVVLRAQGKLTSRQSESEQIDTVMEHLSPDPDTDFDEQQTRALLASILKRAGRDPGGV
jgi:hypothetical protein